MGKISKLKYLRTQLDVRDKLIGGLLHEISQNKISLPKHLISVIEILYYKKGKQNGRDSESKQHLKHIKKTSQTSYMRLKPGLMR